MKTERQQQSTKAVQVVFVLATARSSSGAGHWNTQTHRHSLYLRQLMHGAFSNYLNVILTLNDCETLEHITKLVLKHHFLSNCSSLSDGKPFGQQTSHFSRHQLLKSDQFSLRGWKNHLAAPRVVLWLREDGLNFPHKSWHQTFWWFPSTLPFHNKIDRMPSFWTRSELKGRNYSFIRPQRLVTGSAVQKQLLQDAR